MDLLFILTGLLFVILAVPMILGKVPPNQWFGFRVQKALEDPDVWYPANAYAGKLLLVLGLIIMGTALILPRLLPDLSADNLAWVMVGVMLGGVLIMVLLSWRYLKAL